MPTAKRINGMFINEEGAQILFVVSWRGTKGDLGTAVLSQDSLLGWMQANPDTKIERIKTAHLSREEVV